MIIGITGLTVDREGRRSIAGSGKDTIAQRLVDKHGFVTVALADPLKRFCMEVFVFTEEQMFGPSEKRNEPDKRYPRPLSDWNEAVVKGLQVPREFVLTPEMSHLTPRYALQRLGTEWGRDCYLDLWVDYCLRVAKKIMFGQEHKTHDKWDYSQVWGLYPWNEGPMEDIKGVIIPDLRFINEFKRIKESGGKVWRVKRTVESIPEQLGEGHLSERELLETPDEEFDALFPNEGDIHHLHLLVDAVMARESGRITPYDEAQADVPPFKR